MTLLSVSRAGLFRRVISLTERIDAVNVSLTERIDSTNSRIDRLSEVPMVPASRAG
ncbi:MAG: hypothetical protein WAS54_07320 [Scrofimicrobium sp.]